MLKKTVEAVGGILHFMLESVENGSGSDRERYVFAITFERTDKQVKTARSPEMQIEPADAEELFFMLVRGRAEPVTLEYIVSDYMDSLVYPR